MNKKGVLLAIIITALLAAATWWVTRPQTVATAGPRLVLPGVSSEQVSALEVTIFDGQAVDWLEPGELPGVWTLTHRTNPTQPTLDPPTAWIADAAIAHAAIRILCEAQGDDVVEAAGQSEIYRNAVGVHLRDGRLFQLQFAATTLGGRIAVHVNDTGATGPKGPGRTLLVPASLAQMFTAGSMDAWRLRRMTPVESTASRVKLSAGPRACGLSRVGASWAIVEPALGRGDDQTINELCARLAGLEVSKFADPNLTDAETGLGQPAADVVVESDRRAVVGEVVQRQTIIQEIQIGGRADIGGQSVFVRLSGRLVDPESARVLSSWGPVVGIAAASGLTAISAEPMAYLDRRAVDMVSSDVQRLEFRAGPAAAEAGGPAVSQATASAAARTVNGWAWVSTTTEAAVTPMTAEDGRLLQLLLKLLCDQRADAIVPAGERSPAEELAVVTLVGPGDSRRADLAIWLRSGDTGTPPVLVLTTPGMERRYAIREYTGLVNWLRARVNVAR